MFRSYAALAAVERHIQSTLDDDRNELWLFSRVGETLTRVHDSVLVPNNCMPPFNQTLWGKPERAVFLAHDNALGLLTLLPNDALSVDILSDTLIARYTPIRWFDRRHVFFVGRGQSYQLYRLDVENNLINWVDAMDDQGSVNLEFISPIQHDTLIFDNVILDLTDNSHKPLFDDLASFEVARFVTHYLRWSPDNNGWFFVAGNPFMAIPTMYIMSLDGMVQRQLGRCLPDSSACYGWLPNGAFFR